MLFYINMKVMTHHANELVMFKIVSIATKYRSDNNLKYRKNNL